MKNILTVISTILVISVLFACSSTNNEEITIGVTGPLTGPTANSGVAIKEGMEVAIKEWNERGGIEVDGEQKQIKMIFEDNQGEPSEGVSTAEKLFNNDNVDFMIGDAFASSVTMAIMELASQYEKPILSGQPVSQEISKKVRENPERYKYFWKGTFDAEAYGQTAYNTIESIIESGDFDPKGKKIAYIVEDTDYGRSNVDAASELFNQAGWEQVAFETVEVGHTDFYPQLTKINSVKPDVIISVFTAVSSGVALSKQFDEMKINSLHLGVFYPLRPEFREQAGKSAEGLVWLPLLFDAELIEMHGDFAEKIDEQFNLAATSDHASGYDTMNVALNAINDAKSISPDKIVETLSQTDLNLLLGRYVFEQDSHTVKFGPEFLPVPASQIQDGVNQIIYPKNVATENYKTQPWLK